MTFRWLRTDGGGTDATIAQGGTVTFTTPAAPARRHNVQFRMIPAAPPPPSCVLSGGSGVPALPMPSPAAVEWSGTCTFASPGKYEFFCELHAAMVGHIEVEAAPPPPGETPTGTPAPPPSPPTTGAGGGATPAAAAAGLRLAKHQRGTRVRGSLDVRAAGARVEIVALVRRERLGRKRGPARVRVARFVRVGAQPGRLAFALRLAPAARRALRSRHTLALRVRISTTAPGARTAWVRTVKLTVRTA